MDRRVVVGMAMVGAMLWLLSLGAFAAQPKIELSETSFDFGSIYQGEEVVRTIVLRNAGDDTLVIQKVKSSCGCTAGTPKKLQLAPGETTDFTITFRSAGMHARVKKHVYIDTNDPALPRATIDFEGEVKQEVNLSPRGIYIGQIEKGKPVARTVDVTAEEEKSFKIISVSSDSPLVEIGKPEPLAGAKPGYRLTVMIGPLDAAQRVSAKITIKFDLPHTKEVQIPVYGRIRMDRGDIRPTRPSQPPKPK